MVHTCIVIENNKIIKGKELYCGGFGELNFEICTKCGQCVFCNLCKCKK
ncbi:MAG: hypothetical protein KC550_01985 [Nanoarchaeota archaeon]|nr:hypothetical protein [Nanoarchaeota archaeon]